VTIGAHVRAGGKLLPALERGSEIGAEVIQIFTQSPRAWKPTQYADEVLHEYRVAQANHPTIAATYCHATYLINLAADQDDILARSRACLAANLAAATGMGASDSWCTWGVTRGAVSPTAWPRWSTPSFGLSTPSPAGIAPS
jgi:endonuclease IV